MRTIIVFALLVILAFPGAAHAQTDTDTPTPSPTVTPNGTATATPTATIDARAVNVYATLPSGQMTTLVYSATAGELLNAALEFAVLIALLFLILITVGAKRDR